MVAATFSRDDILRYQGREEGIRQGVRQGIESEIFRSVQDGDYGIERGAQKLNVPVHEFVQKMKDAGFHVPY